MPLLMNDFPQAVKDYFPLNRFTSIISTIKHHSLNALSRSLNFLRQYNPTLNNTMNAWDKSTNLSHIVKAAAFQNVVLYAAPAVGVRLFFSTVRNNESLNFTGLWCVEEGLLLSLFLYMLLANTAYNIALTKAASENLLPLGEDLPSCDNCNVREKIGTGVANIFLYMSLLAAAGGLAATGPSIFEYGIWLLQITAYGYSLGSLPYSARGICTSHISAILNNHKLYYMSLGAMVVYSVNHTCATLNKMTGMRSNFYLEDAIFSLVWQQALVLALMQTQSPDYMHMLRKKMGPFLGSAFNTLLDIKCAAQKRDHVAYLVWFLNTTLGKFILDREPIQFALSVHQKELNTALDSIAWLHDDRLGAFILSSSQLITSTLPKKLIGKSNLIVKILEQQSWPALRSLSKDYLAAIDSAREQNESVVIMRPFTTIENRFNAPVDEKEEKLQLQRLPLKLESQPLLQPKPQQAKARHQANNHKLFTVGAIVAVAHAELKTPKRAVSSSPKSDEDYERVASPETEEPTLVDYERDERGHQVTHASYHGKICRR